MTTTHTPGPWRYGQDQQGTARVFAGTHEIVRALSTHGNRRIPAAERAANARLIAAAPDMLEELRGAAPIMKAAAHRERDVAKARAIKAQADRIEALLAKAEGRAG